jgi:DNA polymerase (family 10)
VDRRDVLFGESDLPPLAALDRGVLFCINPDAHSTREYGALLTGTWVARKAGLSAKEIFNTRDLEEVEEYLDKKRGAARG